jgi:hypothetical protein
MAFYSYGRPAASYGTGRYYVLEVVSLLAIYSLLVSKYLLY